MRRIKEIRENEPYQEIVHTDETWLHAGHRVKKEWVNLKPLENPRRSIVDYGALGGNLHMSRYGDVPLFWVLFGGFPPDFWVPFGLFPDF